MENAKLYPKYRYVMGTLNFLCATFTHSIFIVLSPILTYVANDFAMDYAAVGLAATMHTIAMGIFLLVGSVIIGWIDIRKTQLLGLTIEVLGTVATFFAPTFPLLLAARFVSGMGHGIAGSCTNSVVAAWFPPRERPIVVTCNSLGNVAIITLIYTLTVPLYHAFGDSWRYVVLFFGGILLVLDILWLFLARDNTALNEFLKEKYANEGKKINAFSGMKEALSRPDVWKLCLFMGLATIGTQGISTYLPAFLQNVRGFSDAAASSVVGIATGVGAIATFVGGGLTTVIGKRKIVIIPSLLAGTVCLVLSLVLHPAWLIYVFFFGYTLLSNFRSPASQTVATELPGGSPALTSSAAAMSFGLGFIGNLAVSPLMQLSTATVGEERSLLVFVPLFLLSLLFAVLMPETGPKARKKAA